MERPPRSSFSRVVPDVFSPSKFRSFILQYDGTPFIKKKKVSQENLHVAE